MVPISHRPDGQDFHPTLERDSLRRELILLPDTCSLFAYVRYGESRDASRTIIASNILVEDKQVF